jgi:Ni,Fe-hydrogenase III small subunit/formate hydrogenlyase subunit 6/NADH:ubiquinone oxidoreductase subunit I
MTCEADMLQVALARWKQGHRTIAYPAVPPTLPDRLRGLPIIDTAKCPDGCKSCADACPTDAIRIDERGCRLDLGRCLFCTDCVEACPEGAIQYGQEYRLATRRREDLVYDGRTFNLAEALDDKMRRLFGRSLKLRQVSAGGSGACEADLNVLGTVVFDLGRFGIQFVASPRHADGIVVTGPVSENMRSALLDTYAAVPAPKLVIAVGAEAISGGVFRDHPEVHNGCDSILPVDLYIPGWPPHPMTILDGLLRLLGRLDGDPTFSTPR